MTGSHNVNGVLEINRKGKNVKKVLTATSSIIIMLAGMIGISRQASADDIVGSLYGTVIQTSNHEPIIGASVMIIGGKIGAATDTQGHYRIDNVPAGEYSIIFDCIGFSKTTKTDVIIRPGRNTYVDVLLEEAAIETGNIKVVPNLFNAINRAENSSQEFNSEEIRRSPGSAGDISRMLKALPSQSQVADNSNDLMVRGGSPSENGFYIDGIQVPNINHFPVPGSSGGPIGMLNIDFIDNVSFSAGGFSSKYGDRLSSVTDISYRQGNTEKVESQIDLNMAGFGGVVEGPIGKKGTFLASARKSYLDLISGSIGTGMVPRYGDIQGKATYDLSPHNRIEFLNIYGQSHIKIRSKDAYKFDMPVYGDYASDQNTAGLSWRYLWGKKGFSTTSISHGLSNGNYTYTDVITDTLYEANDYSENAFRLRNVNHYQPNINIGIDFGGEAEYDKDKITVTYGPTYDRIGNYLPPKIISENYGAWKSGLFVDGIFQASHRITLAIGLRGDNFSGNDNFTLSPHSSINYKVTDKLDFRAAVGLYHQTIPFYLMVRNRVLSDLPSISATHYLFGVDYLLTNDTKLTLEMYDKEYSDCPMDPNDPTKFVLDDAADLARINRYEDATSNGKARSRGIEVTLQKKLAQKLYGLAGVSFSRSEYRDLNNVWRPRTFDNRYIVSIIGGYRPNRKWEASFRWNYAGGAPYTPFDQVQSRTLNSGVIDQSRINGARFEDYHSLNLQIDRRFLFRKSNIVAYLSVLNAYNHRNIAINYWSKKENKEREMLQWSFLPVLGFEYEF